MTAGEQDGTWHYAKIYIDRAGQDRLLTDHVLPWWERNTAPERQWFFIRYTEQPRGPHLRFRLWSTSETAQQLFHNLGAAADRLGGTEPTLVCERYRPETDRFGGTTGLAIAHSAFTVDSGIALMLMSRTDLSMMARLASAHHVLTALAGTGLRRRKVYEIQSDWILGELCAQADERARMLATAEANLDRHIDDLPAAREQLFTDHRYHDQLGQLALIGQRLTATDKLGDLTRPDIEVLVDLQHLHFNRLGFTPREEMSALMLLAAAERRNLLP